MAGGAGVRPLTAAEIEAQMPARVDTHCDEYLEEEEFAPAARALFGPACQPLTPALAGQLVGETLYLLWGQQWWDLSGAQPTKAERMETVKEAELVTMVEEGGETNLVFDDPELEDCIFLDRGMFVTGGGSDPVFVFE